MTSEAERIRQHLAMETEQNLLPLSPFWTSGSAPVSPPGALAQPTSVPKRGPLEEALLLTTGDRQQSYGHPLEDFSRTAGLWTALLGKKLLSPITPEEVALCMVCLKLSREMNKHKQDNLVDMAGYVNCLDMLITEKSK
jgi:Domain of unknown function (DUF6378)